MTQKDIYLVIGVILAGFAIPSLLGAFAERRRPLVGFLVLVVGAGLIGLAYSQTPGGITFTDVPEAFIHVIAAIFR